MSPPAPFVDIHSHLLPAVDDGARDMETALALIEQGIEDGIGVWGVTPHVLSKFTESIDQRHRDVFGELVAAVDAHGLPAELCLGSEIMFQGDVETVRQLPSATYGNNGRYLLMEFPTGAFPAQAEQVLYEFQIAGMTPIIAHPERNAELSADISRIHSLVSRGILMQINARSLTIPGSGRVRRTAELIVRSGAAHFVASDAHDPERRPAQVRDAWERVAELVDQEMADQLFIHNPRAALDGARVSAPAPEMPENDAWWRRLVYFFGG